MIELTWRSKPGMTYTVLWSEVLDEIDADVTDDVVSGGEMTTLVFADPTVDKQNPSGSPRVFFRVRENSL